MNHTLKHRLDEYVAGTCSAATLKSELVAGCSATPAVMWETLAVLDQYHRQGKIPINLLREISCHIQNRAMGYQPAVSVADVEEEVMVDEVPIATGANRTTDVSPGTGQLDTASALAAEVLNLREQLSAALQQVDLYREQLRTASLRPSSNTDLRPQPAPLPATPPQSRPAVRHLRLRAVPAVAWLSCLVAMAVSGSLGDPRHEALLATRLVRPETQVPATVPQPGTLRLSASRFIAYPQDRSVEIVVRRTGGTDGAVSFQWWGQSAGAKSGRDFAAKGPRRVTIPDGVDAATLAVPILRNPTRKHTELFYVVLGKPEGGATLGDAHRAPVFIMSP
jgi:hypothetical protein